MTATLTRTCGSMEKALSARHVYLTDTQVSISGWFLFFFFFPLREDSSQMLYGSSHCNVQQVIPMDRFGSFNVFHLPNKNYRRVGKKGRLGGTEDSPLNEFGDGKTKFVGPSHILLTAMELHVEIEKNFPSEKRSYRKKNYSNNYQGVIRMVDDEFDPIPYFKGKEHHMEIIKKRMKAYNDYVLRGGIMSKEDMEGASQHLFLDEEERI